MVAWPPLKRLPYWRGGIWYIRVNLLGPAVCRCRRLVRRSFVAPTGWAHLPDDHPVDHDAEPWG